MKIVRLLVGDGPFTPVAATGCWFGLSVGRRRVSEAVMVGRRAALDTFLQGLKTAGLMDLEKEFETRALESARRIMVVDVELTDILEDLPGQNNNMGN
jgi:hypothetical protein